MSDRAAVGGPGGSGGNTAGKQNDCRNKAATRLRRGRVKDLGIEANGIDLKAIDLLGSLSMFVDGNPKFIERPREHRFRDVIFDCKGALLRRWLPLRHLTQSRSVLAGRQTDAYETGGKTHFGRMQHRKVVCNATELC